MRCAYLYDSLFIENDGFIYPCYFTTSKLGPTIVKHDGKPLHISNVTAEDILSWESLESMRGSMDDGKWPIVCSRCRQDEQQGNKSHRMKAGDHRGKPRLRTIHIRLGNKCNLKCVMCGPNASNQWYDDYVAITGSTNFKVADQIYSLKNKNGRYILDSDRFNFSDEDKIADLLAAASESLEEINFHGGEPMLSKSHRRLLENLIRLGRSSSINLLYHTNATYIDDDLLDMITQFRSVEMILSLDGIGEVNDAIRYPSRWSDISNVIEKFRYNRFKLSVNHTLHFLNAEHLDSFTAEMSREALYFNINPVLDPGYMSLSGLLGSDLDGYNGLSEASLAILRKAADLRDNKSKIEDNRLMFKRLWKIMESRSDNMKSLFPQAVSIMESWR